MAMAHPVAVLNSPMRADGSVDEALDGLLIARRLARCCPTSLSLEDVSSEARPISRRSKSSISNFIPPAPSIATEASPTFRVPIPPAKHRFGFLLADIKPIEIAKQVPKMRYDLPNVKQVQSSVKCGSPVMVVSLQGTDPPATEIEIAKTVAPIK
jgi:hypothetical protein